MNGKIKIALISFLVIFLIVPLLAYGSTIQWEYEVEYGLATPPEGPDPWLIATFDDSVGGSDTVRLTMSTLGLVDNEFVSGWYFNFDPAKDPTQLSFTDIDNSDSVPKIFTDVVDGKKDLQAGGGYKYNILFDFPQSKNVFGANEEVIYDISYIADIDVYSFDFLSLKGGDEGIYKTAAHVQGIGPTDDDSGWVTLPEPSIILLLGSLLIGLGLIGIKRKKY